MGARRSKAATAKAPASTSSEHEAEANAERKVIWVWKQFDQSFGLRWSQHFGNDPLGKVNAEHRMTAWLHAIKWMSWPQVSTAVGKIQGTPKPYDGWLPDLQDFIAAAGRTAAKKPETVDPLDWINGICGTFLLTIIKSHDPLSHASQEAVMKIRNEVQRVYRDLAAKEPQPIPMAERHEWKQLIQTELRMQLKQITVEPLSPEEYEQDYQRWLGSRGLLSGKAGSNSSTPNGR